MDSRRGLINKVRERKVRKCVYLEIGKLHGFLSGVDISYKVWMREWVHGVDSGGKESYILLNIGEG